MPKLSKIKQQLLPATTPARRCPRTLLPVPNFYFSPQPHRIPESRLFDASSIASMVFTLVRILISTTLPYSDEPQRIIQSFISTP